MAESPVFLIEGWYSRSYNVVPHFLIEELKRRYPPEDWPTLYDNVQTLGLEDNEEPSWIQDNLHTRSWKKLDLLPQEVIEMLGRILCKALEAPRDCTRTLLQGQCHNLVFFTNYRVMQVYCSHNEDEHETIKDLVKADQKFNWVPKNPDTKSPYHKKTDPLFELASQYLAWSCYFPDGIDMEALSPRDPNAHVRVKKESTKSKAPAKSTGKEKDHPPPPPPEVHEPPSSDRKDGATYNTGRCLGKGGFAICHEGQLAGTKQKYALKIVKSYMPQKKMEQKVRCSKTNVGLSLLTKCSVPNRTSDPLEDATCQYRPIPSGILLQPMHIHCARAVSKWIPDGYGQEAKVCHRARSTILDCANDWCD